ncbi:hypothetical protein PPYR_09929 [Photinus pyralis]|uniref:Uncharacterized protein n=1 Tax=Photinus pyralis TaxID=7054 RepID=A0A5N4AF62_PHOPY|nr:hypothetical protein PPYR_09929 [Photinus pyralis]
MAIYSQINRAFINYFRLTIKTRRFLRDPVFCNFRIANMTRPSCSAVPFVLPQFFLYETRAVSDFFFLGDEFVNISANGFFFCKNPPFSPTVIYEEPMGEQGRGSRLTLF